MINPINFTYEKFYFPVGEMQVNLTSPLPYDYEKLGVDFFFEKNEEIFELMLIQNALSHIEMKLSFINMPYIPFSRQDRANDFRESFSLKVFANLINSLNVNVVHVTDPHSDVATALINNCQITQQHEVFKKYFEGKKGFKLICPDGGALKKIYKLAKLVDCDEVVEFTKKRNTKTGEITEIYTHRGNMDLRDCYIVDDICDGGRTFIEIAKVLKKKSCGKIILMVTHGFFTKGLEVFDGLIDEIYTLKGQVK